MFTMKLLNVVKLLRSADCLKVSATQQLSRNIATSSVRFTGFFNRLPATQLWGGVTGVSNAGRKRGRGKKIGNRKNTNLNLGQRIGDARSGMVWPGLNSPVTRGKELIKQRQMEPDPEREEKLAKIRNQFNVGFRVNKIPALERGWSGNKFPGRSIGPPDPVHGYKFDGFDTKVLELKIVANMTGNMGRRHQFSAFVVTGNGKGLAGYGLGKAPNALTAIRKAKNRAGQRLQYFELLEDRTIWQDFYYKHYYTAVFCFRKEEGYGLKCHRAITAICEVLGIKDMTAKVDTRSKNIQNLTRAFFMGLHSMQKHDEIAEKHGLHVVQLRRERSYLPEVMSSPEHVSPAQESTNHELAYDRLQYGGRVPLYKAPKQPFYHQLKPYKMKQKRLFYYRNQRQRQIERWARQ